MDNDVMTIAGTIAELRIRAQEGEEAVDHCNREMNKALAQVDHLNARAEKAERERDEARELRDSARALNSKLMENLEFHKRSGREQDVAIGEFRRQLAAAVAANCCKSCEGPLTCAKCVPVQAPGVDKPWPDVIDDHEARIKALEKLEELLEGRLTALVDKVRALEGANLAAHRSIVDLQTKTSRDLVYGPRPLKPVAPKEAAEKIKQAMAAQDQPATTGFCRICNRRVLDPERDQCIRCMMDGR